ncbi:hypothetical protein V2I01_32720 [Micromonospora sp. BRA006-A]|nr:hypothetical protein [Micromonospora sp. BRA006-A]
MTVAAAPGLLPAWREWLAENLAMGVAAGQAARRPSPPARTPTPSTRSWRRSPATRTSPCAGGSRCATTGWSRYWTPTACCARTTGAASWNAGPIPAPRSSSPATTTATGRSCSTA